MSILDTRAVTLGQKYTVSGIAAAQNTFLTITNDSPFLVSYYFDNDSGNTRELPPTSIVENEEASQAAPSLRVGSPGWGGSITIQTSAPLGGVAGTNPQAQQVTIEGFATRRTVSRYSLARNINVGNSVTVGNSSELVAGGDPDGLITHLEAGPGTQYVDLEPTHSITANNYGLKLQYWNGTAYVTVATFDSLGALIALAGLSVAGGPINNVAGQTTGGALGVDVMPTAPVKVVVTALTLQTILSFTPTVDGWYRANITAVLANGTSGNAITAKVNYQDATAVNRSSNFQLISGSTSLIGAGVSSFVNGAWAGVPLFFFAKAGTAISIQYQDPTNTPNDTVSAALERLG